MILNATLHLRGISSPHYIITLNMTHLTQKMFGQFKIYSLIVASHFNDIQYCSILALKNQISQGVTYLAIIFAKACLTAKF